ncbi:hypothetical protein H0I76_18975 [Limibaculum sp. M0105]|uniref:Uncharacterized protein n=1 Tax=Thermohalobaculum xanthum TaxID=2753746 RepID=A0A8J7MAQ2_9RHOB|nr:hypothetical protein [Thermohalobaculum xanthum]MBK0401286.1 hypothetical protein [Thermohalobaculum xanthum]
MTADTAGKAAVREIWAMLRKIRDQWVMIVFLTGALVWARDTWERLAALPAAIDGIAAGVEQLTGQLAAAGALAGHGAGAPGGAGRAGPVLGFPGERHGATDARPGEWSEVRLDPVRPTGRSCVPLELDAFVVDAAGRWFQAEATIGAPPVLEPEGDLAFGVRVPAAVPAGRAAIALSFVHDCGGDLVVDAAPRLPIRVLAD